jgi:hypothetical protein
MGLTQSSKLQQFVLETIVVILSCRRNRSDLWTSAHALLPPKTSSSFTSSRTDLPQSCVAPGCTSPPPTVLLSNVLHVLFFDGGSRGNPGSGMSGACVVHTMATAVPIKQSGPRS